MFKHGYRYDEAEAEVARYKIPLGIAILGSSLPQEVNARVAIRRKRSFACFISLLWTQVKGILQEYNAQ